MFTVCSRVGVIDCASPLLSIKEIIIIKRNFKLKNVLSIKKWSHLSAFPFLFIGILQEMYTSDFQESEIPVGDEVTQDRTEGEGNNEVVSTN